MYLYFAQAGLSMALAVGDVLDKIGDVKITSTTTVQEAMKMLTVSLLFSAPPTRSIVAGHLALSVLLRCGVTVTLTDGRVV